LEVIDPRADDNVPHLFGFNAGAAGTAEAVIDTSKFLNLTDPGGMTIQGFGTDSPYFDGMLGELVIGYPRLDGDDLADMKEYFVKKWLNVNNLPVFGGIITRDLSYRYHKFSQTGDLYVLEDDLVDVEALIVGAGGGAGMSNVSGYFGGGGGAGAINEDARTTPFTLPKGRHSVVVGLPGSSGTSVSLHGGEGGESSFYGYEAAGGGGGGGQGGFPYTSASEGLPGANGGGGAGVQVGTGPVPSGGVGVNENGGAGSNHDSGFAGGGGGYGGAGSAAASGAPGGAGDVVNFDLQGNVTYAEGGKAGGGLSIAQPLNTGTGGHGTTAGSDGQAGSAGIVWIRYPIPFDVLDIPGLQAWFDASDASTFTLGVGDAVTQWRDKSPHARHVGPLPWHRNITVNGLAAVQGAGTTGATFPTTIPVFANSYYYFAVVAHPAGSHLLIHGTASNVYGLFVDSNNFYTVTVGSAAAVINDTRVQDGVVRVFGINGNPTSTPAQSHAYLDGDESGPYNHQGLSFTGLANYGGGLGFGGKVCEIIIGDVGLSETDAQVVRDYLKNKWGTA
jgi:hypothetical protein